MHAAKIKRLLEVIGFRKHFSTFSKESMITIINSF